MKNLFFKTAVLILTVFTVSCSDTTSTEAESPALKMVHISLEPLLIEKSFYGKYYNSKGELIGSRDTIFADALIDFAHSFGRQELSLVVPVQQTIRDTFMLRWQKADTTWKNNEGRFSYDAADYNVAVVIDKNYQVVKYFRYSYKTINSGSNGTSLETSSQQVAFILHNIPYSKVNSNSIKLDIAALDFTAAAQSFIYDSSDEIKYWENGKEALLHQVEGISFRNCFGI